jgi:tryptophan synthase alpha chain
VLEDHATQDLVLAMAEKGMDAVELGIPFSDPVADGPVIEKAAMIALKNGFRFDRIYGITKAISAQVDTLWMGYFNPFYHKGIETVAQKGETVGLKGLIIPDLPYEEALPYKPLFKKHGISIIDFVAPTDPKSRIEKIIKDAETFIYLVAYAGITGAGKSEDLAAIAAEIKQVSSTPLYVGFGVDKNTAKEKARHADGVIVGSAFVKTLIDEGLTAGQKIDRIAALAGEIKSLINE